MSTSMLYHAYHIKDVQYKFTSYEKGNIIFHVKMKRGYFPCSDCKCSCYIFKGNKIRRFNIIPFGNKKCFLELYFHRLQCCNCKKIFWPKLNFMKGKRRMTRSFIRYILDLLKIGTIKDVSTFLNLGWDVVKDIHKEKLNILHKKISLKKLIYIGVDEFSIKKGHNYMTIFTDLKTGRIIHAIEGRKKEIIEPFLKKLKKNAKELKAIAMDMSGPYYSAVKEFLPHVDVVFDHFHITALMNRAIDKVRREQYVKNANAIKGSKYLLLSNYDNLDADKKTSLNKLLGINRPISIAYYMKEQFRLFWHKKNTKEAARFLGTWIIDAIETDIIPLQRIARTLIKYSKGILNYFKHRISNAITEGINNKIKTLKRQAYGFRDMDYFKLRLYHLHQQKYSLAG